LYFGWKIIVSSSTERSLGRISGGRGREHDYFGWALIAFVAYVPIPFGSNRPFFWMLNALIIGVIGLFYAGSLFRSSVKPRLGLSDIGLPVLLFSLAVVWLAVQIVPLNLLPHPSWASLEDSGRGAISAEPGETLGMLVRYVSYGLFFLLAVQVFVNRSRAHRLLQVLFWVAVGESILALASLYEFGDVLLFFKKVAYEGNATGTFVNRNTFATFVAMGMVIGVALLFGDGRNGENTRLPWLTRIFGRQGVIVVGMLVIAFGVAASQSRMGIFVAGAGSLTVLVLSLFRVDGTRRFLAIAIIMCIIGGAMTLALTGGIFFERLWNVDQSADGRMAVYAQTVDLIAQHPLLGSGGGSFEDTFNAIRHPPVSSDVIWNRAHNLYLELSVDLGIPVAAGVVLAVLLLAWRCLGAAFRRQESWEMPAASIGATVLVGLHSMVDFSMQIEGVVFFYLTILAAGVAQSTASTLKRQGR
jgi:O-antigen ligase